MTARPQDGPKASRLPSHGREIFSLHLSPPSETPPTYESGYTSSVGGAVAFLISGYDFLPLAQSPPRLPSSRYRYRYGVHLTSACPYGPSDEGARFSTPEI